MKRRLTSYFPKGSVRQFVVILAFFIVLNIIFTGLLKSKIRRVNNAIITVDAQYQANLTHHSSLFSLKQELLRRDRIIDYAQHRLGMELLKPDIIASGQIIKEVREEQLRHNPVYAFVDFITPSTGTFERRK